jgi:hypothetical protein
MAGFWRTWQRWSGMARHLSYRQYQVQLDGLNRTAYRKLSQNKIAEKAILTLTGIPTARFIGLLDVKNGRAGLGAPLRNADELARLISSDPANRICFKLVEGHGGRGFVAVDVLRHPALGFRLLGTADILSAHDLVVRLGDAQRIVEVYLDQHPAYAAFNPTSVNTLRIWVLRRNETTTARLAFLRVGRRGSLVDNRSAGGIVAPVDIATGRLSHGLDGQPHREVFRMHPDTGAQIEGAILPMFADARALAEQALNVFPHMNFAGVDVAMTPSGPAIVELNVQADRSGAAHVGIPTKDVFGL